MSSATDTKTFKDAFALFDKKGAGKIPVGQLGDMLRAVGQSPTQAEVSELEKSVEGDSFDFDTFVKIVQRPNGFKPLGEVDDYVRAFQVFDKEGTGAIGVGELRYILTSMGERLSDSEMDELLEGIQVGKDGTIDYKDLVKTILAQ